jgi:transposase InsO family protein
MTGDVEKFSEIDLNISGKVRFGDGSAVEIVGKGSVLFLCKNGIDQWLLHDVFYIPKLKSNLISLGQLTETGHKIGMDDDWLEVVDKLSGKLIMKVLRTKNRLYKIEMQPARPVCLMGSIEEPAWLWHARLGHVNFRSMKVLGEKEMATGVPKITHPEQVCHGCLAGKQTRKAFPYTTSFRADKPLQLVYVDWCGPITPATPAGNNYFMLLVDDFSRWMCVYMLKSKDQASDVSAKYKAEVENQTRQKIKVLRSHRGGEFLSGIFAEICEDAGIRRQLTAPYSPQQNGVVERRNRTVMEMARCMLKGMKIPGKFWGEAVRHAVYLLNRLPSKPMGEVTPFEAWNGRKPHLGHLRVFGCLSHAKQTAPHPKKLDDRSHKMVYFGVAEGSKAHRLYDPVQKRIIVSRDVIFEEAVMWGWIGESVDNLMDFQVEEKYGDDNMYWETDNVDQEPVQVQEEQGGVHVPDDPQSPEAVSGNDAAKNPPQEGIWSQVDAQQNSELLDNDHSDSEPVHFRNLSEIYQDTEEVELAESDVEVFLA